MRACWRRCFSWTGRISRRHDPDNLLQQAHNARCQCTGSDKIGFMRRNALLGIIWISLLFASCARSPAPDPTETPTAVPSVTSTVTSTPSPLPSSTPTITPTPEPGWYQSLEASLSVLKYDYALVKNPQAKVYPSLQDAVSQSFNYANFPAYPAYVAYASTQTKSGQTYYGLKSGNWMSGADLEPLTPSAFKGLLLTRPVNFRFGWVLHPVQSVNSIDAPIHTFSRYEIVQEDLSMPIRPGYLAVGPDEWLPESALALVSPGVPRDADPNYCRFIYVNLAEQTLQVYQDCQLVFATLISSGENALWTFPGRFAILYKVDYTTLEPPPESTSSYYIEGVPYFMTYFGNLGFHGAYWQDSFGAPSSHGCINMSPADATWLYKWAEIGDRVVISAGK